VHQTPPFSLPTPYSTDGLSPATSLIPSISDSDAGVTLRRPNEPGIEASQGERRCAFPTPFCLIIVFGGVGPLYQPGTIGSIPDDPLLQIFSFCVEQSYAAYDPDQFRGIKKLEAWRPLVHVCRRWRDLIFISPRRLNLRLVCTGRRRVREMLGIWPDLPIVIDDGILSRFLLLPEEHADNIVAALEHRDRVCQITFANLPPSLFPIFASMMQESFPALTRLYFDLDLDSEAESPVLPPDSFLGGSAPQLRSLTLGSIPMPSLPTLLSTTKDLIELRLWTIPDSGYISPAVMATCLSSLPRLENLCLRFDERTPPDGSSQHPSSLTLINLPTLTHFEFLGTNKYIEELVVRINAPSLRDISVAFFNEPLFDISQLNQFIGRAKIFRTPDRAVVDFDRSSAFPQFSLVEDQANGVTLEFLVSTTPPEWQLLSLALLSSSPSSPLRPSSFKRLDIQNRFTSNTDMKKVRWLELLRPFTSVKDLYLGNRIAPHITRMLQDLAGEITAEVLPALEHVFVQGCQQLEALRESIGPLIAARQLVGHPVAIHRWEGLQEDDGWAEDDVREEEDGWEEDDGREEDDGWEEDDSWVEDDENDSLVAF